MPYEADSLFAKILGPLATTASVRALGGDPAKFIANFRKYEPQHYAYGVSLEDKYWEDANYYDRVRTYYQWHASATDQAKRDEYLRKGHELAVNYRDNYAPNGDVSAHWGMPVGITLHHLLTGDATSRNWVMNVGQTMAAPYYTNNIGDTEFAEMDNRIQARCLEAWILCWLLTGDEKWRTLLRTGLTDILGTQSDDGAYRFVQQGHNNKPFMVGILNDAMLLYQRVFEKDPRIPESIRKSCEYMWSHNWYDTGFEYQEGDQGGEPSHDLNNLVLNGFTASGMNSEADEIFKGSLLAWLDGSKQFNQSYVSAYLTLAKKEGVASAWSGQAVPEPEPPPSGETDADVEGAKTALAAAQIALADATAQVDTAMAKLGGEPAHGSNSKRYKRHPPQDR